MHKKRYTPLYWAFRKITVLWNINDKWYIIKCAMKHNLLDTSMNDCQERMANNHVLKVLFKFLNNTLWWLPKQWQNSIDYIYYAFEQLSNWFVVNLNNADWGINQKIIKIILTFARRNLYTKKKKRYMNSKFGMK